MSGTYSGDFNYSKYTPVDNTGYIDIFRSGFKNIRFNVQQSQQVTLDASTAFNLPGLAYNLYADTSLWHALLSYNGLSDPLTDVQPGVVLKIPSKASLLAFISRQQTNRQQTITI